MRRKKSERATIQPVQASTAKTESEACSCDFVPPMACKQRPRSSIVYTPKAWDARAETANFTMSSSRRWVTLGVKLSHKTAVNKQSVPDVLRRRKRQDRTLPQQKRKSECLYIHIYKYAFPLAELSFKCSYEGTGSPKGDIFLRTLVPALLL